MASEANIMGWLKLNPVGRYATDIKSKYGITLTFKESPRPAEFNGSSTVNINSGAASVRAAAYFVHEMHHVEQNKTGKSIPETSPDKDAYVKNAVTEEYEASYKHMYYFLLLDINGYLTNVRPLNDSNAPDMYNDFKYNFDVFYKQISQNESDKDKAVAAAVKSCARALRGWIDAGRLGTGTALLPMTYSAFYSSNWKNAHRN